MVKTNHRKSESLLYEGSFLSPSKKTKGKHKQDNEDLSTSKLSSEIDRLISSSSIGKDFHYVPKYREHESLFLKKEKNIIGDKKRKSGGHSRNKLVLSISTQIKNDNEEDLIPTKNINDENNEQNYKNTDSSEIGNKETNENNVQDKIRDKSQDTATNEVADVPKELNISSSIPYLECDKIDEGVLEKSLQLDTDDTYEAFSNDILLAPSFGLFDDIVKKDISFSKSSANVLPCEDETCTKESKSVIEKNSISHVEENALEDRTHQFSCTEEGAEIDGISMTIEKQSAKESHQPIEHNSAAFLAKLNIVSEKNSFKAEEDQNISPQRRRKKNVLEPRPGVTMTLGRSLEESLGSSAAARRHNVLRIKIISMGPAGCGKSCLIKRFCERRFITKYITTIGVDYGVHRVPVDRYDVRVNFWDLSGQREFFEIRNEFYKDAQGALLVFDSTNRKTFEELEQWIEEVKIFGGNTKIPIVVCNNKIDKLKNHYESLLETENFESTSSAIFKKKKKNFLRTSREVSQEEAEIWCKFRGYHYFETSAASNENVDEMFQCLFEKTVEDVKQI